MAPECFDLQLCIKLEALLNIATLFSLENRAGDQFSKEEP